MKCCAAIERRFAQNTPAVTMNNSLHDRQADAGSFEFVCAMQSLKYPEKLVSILHFKTRPVIADKINIFAVVGLTPDFDDCCFTLARVLQRVREQVRPYLLQ